MMPRLPTKGRNSPLKTVSVWGNNSRAPSFVTPACHRSGFYRDFSPPPLAPFPPLISGACAVRETCHDAAGISQLVDDLFDRLAGGRNRSARSGGGEPDYRRPARAPHAVYALVQTTLLQDEALKRANAHIEELQAQTGGAGPPPLRQGSFLDSMGAFGGGAPRGSVPNVRPAGGYQSQPGPQPQMGYPPQMQSGYPALRASVPAVRSSAPRLPLPPASSAAHCCSTASVPCSATRPVRARSARSPATGLRRGATARQRRCAAKGGRTARRGTRPARRCGRAAGRRTRLRRRRRLWRRRQLRRLSEDLREEHKVAGPRGPAASGLRLAYDPARSVDRWAISPVHSCQSPRA